MPELADGIFRQDDRIVRFTLFSKALTT